MNCSHSNLGRRGFTTVIFKWLFGVVAGVFILIFLIRFAVQHTDVSTTLTEREALEYFDDQLAAFHIAESSSKILEVPESLVLTATCEGFGIGSALRQSNTIVFAPTSFQGEVRAWTELWKFPYPITNVFYISDASTRFLLVYDDASRAFVQGLRFPQLFSVQMLHVRDFQVERVRQESGTKAVHLVFFTTVPTPQRILHALPRARVLEVNHETSHVLYHNTGAHSFYLGESMLYGAIFSPELFSCLQEKAQERLRFVTEVYAEEVALLQLKASEVCASGFASLHEALEHFVAAHDPVELLAIVPEIERAHQSLRRNTCVSVY